jgi:hypothetical protein
VVCDVWPQQEYSDEAKLKEKLTTALMHAEGFGLV